jgi:predicted ATP-binding protein involved in virulence
MKLNQIKINSFRDIPELKLDFPSNLKVIIGNDDNLRKNILDAIALCISNLFSGFHDFNPLPIKESDNYYYKPCEVFQEEKYANLPPLSMECEVLIDDKKFNYTRKLNEKKTNDLTIYSKDIQQKIMKGEDYFLPVIAYYRADRRIITRNKEFKTTFKPCSQMVGYKDCFNSPNGRMISCWFHTMAMVESQRNMTVKLFERFKEILKSAGLPIDPYEENQTRCCQYLLAIIADLAYRSAVLNPQQMLYDKKTCGIVLIDAVELNLDLAWQREIMPKLAEIFPEIQFIVTTDSPLVLSTTKPQDIICLESEYLSQGCYTLLTKIPEASYGQTCDRILEDLLDTPARPKEIKDKILYISKMIEEGDINEAITARNAVAEEIGHDPELTKQGIQLDRLAHSYHDIFSLS